MRNLFAFLCIMLIASSCDRDENRIPAPLIGSWEMVGLNNHLELDYATTYVFNANGTYTHRSTLREVGKTEDLGYIFYETGNYRVEENDIIFALKEHFHKPFASEKLFYSRGELEQGHIEPNREGSATFEIRNSGQELFFPGGIRSGDIMVPDYTYIRVD